MKVVSMMLQYQNPSAIKKLVLSKNIRQVTYINLSSLDSLEEIQVADGNPYYWAEDGILFEKTGKQTRLVYYPRNKKGTSYTIPDNVDYVESAFVNNNNLKKLTMNNKITDAIGAEGSNLETIVLSDSIKWIGESAFENCKKLTKVVMGKNVKSIDKYAFSGCTSLSQITLPDQLESIGYWAFKNCKSLKSVKIPASVTKVSAQAFVGCPAKITKEAYLLKQKDGSYVAKVDVVNTKGKTKQYKLSKVTKISALEKNIALKKGKTKKIKTSVYISGTKKGILDASVLNYTVSNSKILKVSKKGKITALKKGTTTIKVKLKGSNLSYNIKVKVK
jgi:hypothetical protein